MEEDSRSGLRMGWGEAHGRGGGGNEAGVEEKNPGLRWGGGGG